MKIPVIVEPVAGNGYVARNFGLGLEGHGATREEAVKSASASLAEKIQRGATIAETEANSFDTIAGMYKDNPLIDEWIEAMAEYRREREAELDAEET